MRAIVIGNVAVDETINVDALPAEGASILGHGRRAELGGKGANQAVILARAGVEVTFVAAIGDDERGALVRRSLAAEPLEARLLTVPYPTDASIILRDREGANAIVTTVDCAGALDVEAAVGSLDGSGQGSLVVLQGNLDERTTRALFDAAAARSLPIVFNPSPVAAWQAALLGRCAAVFANEHEAAILTGMEPRNAAVEIVRRGANRAVVTMGAAGLWLASPEATEPQF